MEKGAFSKYIRTGSRGWVTIWEDSKDNYYLNTMPRLVILLNKPLSRYYGDDKYLEGLNNINTIISINIHLFIIESPALNISLCRPLIQYYLLKLNDYIYKSFRRREISKKEFFKLF